MWNATNRRKNSYLQSRINIMNPALLNQCVDTARQKPFSILSRRKILNSQLNPDEPQRFGPTVQNFKARLAYGLWGLPKILREICSKDVNVQYRALNTLSDLLVNPLECKRAINDYNVVYKLEEILLLNLPETRETMPTIDKILENFEILARNFEGSWRMVALYDLIKTLYSLVKNSGCIKDKPAKILRVMSSHPTVADVMLIHGHLKSVSEVIRFVDNVKDVYIHLANLIKRAPAGGMEAGFFDLLLPKMCIKNHVQSSVMKCMALLLSTSEGHELFDKIDGIKILYGMLQDDLPVATLEYVALAMQNSTINKRTLWRCREFWDLPLILIRHAHSRINDHMQLYCIQTLRQITTMPSIKDFVRKTCKKQIKNIECQTEFVKEAKERLLKWLRKKNYKNIEPKLDLESEEEEVLDQSLSESESENCDQDYISSDDSSSQFGVGKEPKPIAYRLDYGNICLKKIVSPPQSQYYTSSGKHGGVHLDYLPLETEKTSHAKQSELIIANLQQSSAFVHAGDFTLEDPKDGPVPQRLTVIEELQRTTVVASRHMYDDGHEQNNIPIPQIRPKTSVLPVMGNINPNDILTVPLLQDLPPFNTQPSDDETRVPGTSLIKIIPFIEDEQRVAFIKGPPKSRTYFAVSAKHIGRRHGVRLEPLN